MKSQKILALSVVVSLMIGSMAIVTVMAMDNEIRQDPPDGFVGIHDWHDLYDVRDDLSGSYALMNDLNETTDGYMDYNDPATYGWLPIGAQV